MMKSMTAFGRAVAEGEERNVTVELKSVNSRFFDATVKLPRAYLFLEEKIKGYVQKNGILRGKVDIFISVEEKRREDGAVALDEAFLSSYLSCLYRLRDEYKLRDDITVMGVARQADIFRRERAAEDLDRAWEWLRPILDEALVGYVEMRSREGERIASDMLLKLEGVKTLVNEIEEISKQDTVGYRDKLESRIRQILGEAEVAVDENRLLTECAIWADKIAIDEELVRLRSHFEAFVQLMALPEPSGRKLDFLMQEMNRETNTIGSKANNASIARLVVSIKGELEKMREQIQNIE
ncbi:MAG: YicC family protein [Clostridia bacterium]|nr:YicC family protein [Clostridia bacterium]